MRSLRYNCINLQLFPASNNYHLNFRARGKFCDSIDSLLRIGNILVLNLDYNIAGIDPGRRQALVDIDQDVAFVLTVLVNLEVMSPIQYPVSHRLLNRLLC